MDQKTMASMGGIARAKILSPKRRAQIARKAGLAPKKKKLTVYPKLNLTEWQNAAHEAAKVASMHRGGSFGRQDGKPAKSQ